MPSNTTIVTVPQTGQASGDGAVSFDVVNRCVLAAVILNYTAGAGGADREIAIEVLDANSNVVCHAPAGAVLAPTASMDICFAIGGVHAAAEVDGVLAANLPTIPLDDGYTIQVSQTGALADSDDTVTMTVHLMR